MAYSQSTLRKAESILGYGIQDGYKAREYPVIDNVVYTDLFTGTPVIEGYTGPFELRFNGSQRTDYYNEIIIKDRWLKSVEVDPGGWGDSCFMKEIKELLDWIEANPFADLADSSSVKSKKIEDFSVTLKDSEESSKSLYTTIISSWSFYIRKPLIVSVTPEQKNDYRYF